MRFHYYIKFHLVLITQKFCSSNREDNVYLLTVKMSNDFINVNFVK